MEKKLDSILEYLELLKHGQERLEENQERLEEKIDHLSSETRSGFTDENSEDYKEIFKGVSRQMRNLQIDVDFLSGKTGKHDLKLNRIEKRIQS
ncbi:hypothetical protein [Halobacillus amylolyticus]|uniref:Uncharacterized protein n=1 Tax=Halobacillus amylolyticus TaxID=2932259 RepID=A0ABY4HA12_9BACI|nr:hypothetical protein [Halobacillus amylolyticus]UOR11292.1 hypothetical protein MUO15_17090 [Halobacillus amylolyticus]